jgi:hypothetical protein
MIPTIIASSSGSHRLQHRLPESFHTASGQTSLSLVQEVLASRGAE